MAIKTNNITRIAITSSGAIGIGTTAPGASLDLKGAMRFSGASSGFVGLQAPSISGSTTYTLPSSDGTTAAVLSTNGSGVLSWSSPGSWRPTSCSTSWTNNTTTLCGYQCVNSRSVAVNYELIFSNAPNSTPLNANLPAIFTVDSTAAPGGNGTYIAGTGAWHGMDTGIKDYVGTVFFYIDTGGTYCLPSTAAGQVDQTSPFSVGSGDKYNITCVFPVTSCI